MFADVFVVWVLFTVWLVELVEFCTVRFEVVLLVVLEVVFVTKFLLKVVSLGIFIKFDLAIINGLVELLSRLLVVILYFAVGSYPKSFIILLVIG